MTYSRGTSNRFNIVFGGEFHRLIQRGTIRVEYALIRRALWSEPQRRILQRERQC